MDYKKLYEQTLAENKALKEELDVWVNPTGDVVMNREGMMIYEASREEIEELKEEINGDGFLKQGYKTELSNSHKQQNRMVKEIVELKKKNEELNLTIDCHLAELEFTNANALDEPRAFIDWLKRTYDEERYQQIYDWLNLYEYLDEEE